MTDGRPDSFSSPSLSLFRSPCMGIFLVIVARVLRVCVFIDSFDLIDIRQRAARTHLFFPDAHDRNEQQTTGKLVYWFKLLKCDQRIYLFRAEEEEGCQLERAFSSSSLSCVNNTQIKVKP
jgi:hypothetical protein